MRNAPLVDTGLTSASKFSAAVNRAKRTRRAKPGRLLKPNEIVSRLTNVNRGSPICLRSTATGGGVQQANRAEAVEVLSEPNGDSFSEDRPDLLRFATKNFQPPTANRRRCQQSAVPETFAQRRRRSGTHQTVTRSPFDHRVFRKRRPWF